MFYREFRPSNRLAEHVKCFFVYQASSEAAFDDTVFPNGCMEIVFNLGDGHWQTEVGAAYVTTPAVELWGQIVKPLPIRSVGKNAMLGVRFNPHAGSAFVKDNIRQLHNQVVSYSDVAGKDVETLRQRLLNTEDWNVRISLVEHFLLTVLSGYQKKSDKRSIVTSVMQELKQDQFFDNIEKVANRYGITSRYLQKLFLQHTGLTPKLYCKINRFQNSLKLVSRKDTSLTSIAFDCGYFDQSHFIREFKSFTGVTPSGYTPGISPITVPL